MKKKKELKEAEHRIIEHIRKRFQKNVDFIFEQKHDVSKEAIMATISILHMGLHKAVIDSFDGFMFSAQTACEEIMEKQKNDGSRIRKNAKSGKSNRSVAERDTGAH